MNIRELIPAVVEEVVAGVEASREAGVDVAPAALVIDIELPLSTGGQVRTKVEVFPHLRRKAL